MQNVGEVQETALTPPFGSTLTGALHAVPSNVRALPVPSKATQKVDEVQEIATRLTPEPMAVAVQLLPSKVSALP